MSNFFFFFRVDSASRSRLRKIKRERKEAQMGVEPFALDEINLKSSYTLREIKIRNLFTNQYRDLIISR